MILVIHVTSVITSLHILAPKLLIHNLSKHWTKVFQGTDQREESRYGFNEHLYWPDFLIRKTVPLELKSVKLRHKCFPMQICRFSKALPKWVSTVMGFTRGSHDHWSFLIAPMCTSCHRHSFATSPFLFSFSVLPMRNAICVSVLHDIQTAVQSC